MNWRSNFTVVKFSSQNAKRSGLQFDSFLKAWNIIINCLVSDITDSSFSGFPLCFPVYCCKLEACLRFSSCRTPHLYLPSTLRRPVTSYGSGLPLRAYELWWLDCTTFRFSVAVPMGHKLHGFNQDIFQTRILILLFNEVMRMTVSLNTSGEDHWICLPLTYIALSNVRTAFFWSMTANVHIRSTGFSWLCKLCWIWLRNH